MTPIKFTILGRTPSKKNTHRRKYSRKLGRWIIAADSKAWAWENQAIMQLLQQKNKQGFDTIKGKLWIEFKIYLSTYRRLDLSNIIQSCEDVLWKSAVIEDDFFIYSLDGSRRILGVDPKDERAEITIKEFVE
jgi:Holliday junction resolvase RusA-like endonuclease